MYYKKPAITFTIEGSGVNYVALKDETCLECENQNFEQFANSIKELASNKELAKNYGEAGYDRVMSNFTFDEFKNNLKKILAE